MPWKSVRSIRKIKLGKGIFSKSILRLTPRSLGSYRLNFMQKISAKSEFGSFSIPLYAMNNKDAQRIEKEIHAHLCQTKTQTRLAKGKKEAKKKKIFNSTPSVKRKTKKVKDKK